MAGVKEGVRNGRGEGGRSGGDEGGIEKVHPFHTIVAAEAITDENCSTDLGPQSSPIQSAKIPLSTVAVPV